MVENKLYLDGLFCEDPQTLEGKYHVQRRDGTTVEWPSFVLGARDPASVWALRAYAIAGWFYGFKWGYLKGVWRRAKFFRQYRTTSGNGDPDKGRHRPDDPDTIAKMRKGLSS